MESYPEQCNTPDGKHFTRELSDEEKQKLTPPLQPSLKANENTYCKYQIEKPVVKPSKIEGWNLYTGRILMSSCFPKFSIEYPSNWYRDGNLLYPYGKKDSKSDTIFEFGAGGSGAPDVSEYGKITYTAGEAEYAWGVVTGTEYIAGSTVFKKDDDYYLFRITRLPKQQEKEFQLIYNQVLSTFKFLE